MNTKNKIRIKYLFQYFLLLIILKNMNYITSIPLEKLNDYFFIFIPITYLIVKYLFIYDIEKHHYQRKDFLLVVMLGCTILNFLFQMPIFYSVCLFLFFLLIKDKETKQTQKIEKNILEYYQNQEEGKKRK